MTIFQSGLMALSPAVSIPASPCLPFKFLQKEQPQPPHLQPMLQRDQVKQNNHGIYFTKIFILGSRHCNRGLDGRVDGAKSWSFVYVPYLWLVCFSGSDCAFSSPNLFKASITRIYLPGVKIQSIAILSRLCAFYLHVFVNLGSCNIFSNLITDVIQLGLDSLLVFLLQHCYFSQKK